MCRLYIGFLCLPLVFVSANTTDKVNIVNKPNREIEGMKSVVSKVLRIGGQSLNETTTEKMIHGSCICSKIYDPVCGSNNKSYYNTCLLECDRTDGNITVVHQGNCIPF